MLATFLLSIYFLLGEVLSGDWKVSYQCLGQHADGFGLGFRVWGLGFRVSGLEFRVLSVPRTACSFWESRG